jgi:hypothetical protein
VVGHTPSLLCKKKNNTNKKKHIPQSVINKWRNKPKWNELERNRIFIMAKLFAGQTKIILYVNLNICIFMNDIYINSRQGNGRGLNRFDEFVPSETNSFIRFWIEIATNQHIIGFKSIRHKCRIGCLFTKNSQPNKLSFFMIDKNWKRREEEKSRKKTAILFAKQKAIIPWEEWLHFLRSHHHLMSL